jgi:hypothetical protein
MLPLCGLPPDTFLSPLLQLPRRHPSHCCWGVPKGGHQRGYKRVGTALLLLLPPQPAALEACHSAYLRARRLRSPPLYHARLRHCRAIGVQLCLRALLPLAGRLQLSPSWQVALVICLSSLSQQGERRRSTAHTRTQNTRHREGRGEEITIEARVSRGTSGFGGYERLQAWSGGGAARSSRPVLVLVRHQIRNERTSESSPVRSSRAAHCPCWSRVHTPS